MTEELNISKDKVSNIVRENLGKRKICSQFVLCMLTDDQKAKQMEAAGDFITVCVGKCAIWRIGSRCQIAILSTIWHFAFSVVFQTLGKELKT